ncbi:MAG TPA: hypothetical protein VIL32_03770, partial [Steroidobacteraceae bacterium]
MRFGSTRETQRTTTFSEAVERGLAPDGGLYMPESWPKLGPAAFGDETELARIGLRLLAPFAQDDRLAEHLPAITAEAFNFPAPLVPV